MERSPCLCCLPFSTSLSPLNRLRFSGRASAASACLSFRGVLSGEVRRCVFSSLSRRRRSFASCASFSFSEALWLSVSRIMFLRNLVFGLGAFVAGLIKLSALVAQFMRGLAHRFGIWDCKPRAEYLMVLSLASLVMRLAT